jgi:hypothetical protein
VKLITSLLAETSHSGAPSVRDYSMALSAACPTPSSEVKTDTPTLDAGGIHKYGGRTDAASAGLFGVFHSNSDTFTALRLIPSGAPFVGDP